MHMFLSNTDACAVARDHDRFPLERKKIESGAAKTQICRSSFICSFHAGNPAVEYRGPMNNK
jgi:hypothetical protein